MSLFMLYTNYNTVVVLQNVNTVTHHPVEVTHAYNADLICMVNDVLKFVTVTVNNGLYINNILIRSNLDKDTSTAVCNDFSQNPC